MKLRTTVLCLVLGAAATAVWILIGSYHHVSNCQIIHAQLGCPRGTTMLHNFFTERDGSKIDACLKPTGEDCVDELRPGESMSVRLNRMK